MKQTRARVKNLISPDDFRYAAREYRDYAIAKEMQDDLKVMAYTALGRLEFDIQESKEKSNFGVVGKEAKYHWFCYVKERGYMFFSESEIGLYCQIIEHIVGNQLYMPFN